MWRDEALAEEDAQLNRAAKGAWQLATLTDHASFNDW